MSLRVLPVSRLFLITLLMLLSSIVVEIETLAIPRPASRSKKNENSTRLINSTRTQIYISTANRISRIKDITTPLAFGVEKEDNEGVNENQDDLKKVGDSNPLDNITPDRVPVPDQDVAFETKSMEKTTQSNILSIPSRRSKKMHTTTVKTANSISRSKVITTPLTLDTEQEDNEGVNENQDDLKKVGDSNPLDNVTPERVPVPDQDVAFENTYMERTTQTNILSIPSRRSKKLHSTTVKTANSISRSKVITTPLTLDSEKEDNKGVNEDQDDLKNIGDSNPLDNVFPERVPVPDQDVAFENTSTERTAQSNILSIPSRRSKKLHTTTVKTANSISRLKVITTPVTLDIEKDDNEGINEDQDNVTPEMVPAPNQDVTIENMSTVRSTQSNIFSIPTRRQKKIHRTIPPSPTTPRAESHILSMISLEEESSTERKLKYNNGIVSRSNVQTTANHLQNNKLPMINSNYSMKNDSQKSTSHIYKVNSNYKRYKKLNIVPPKPLWKDPNDNSWRNESISSLGIKFTPNINTTKAFQFKKKDLSELEMLMSETENSTSPGLRERLEKLSEIRKSKKKFNTTSMEDLEYEYESESPTTPITLSTSTKTQPTRQFRLTTPAPQVFTRPVNALSKKQEDYNDETDISNAYHQNTKLIVDTMDSEQIRTIPDSQTITDNLENPNKNKELEKIISNSKYYQTEYKWTNNKTQNEGTTGKSRPNQFDYNLDSDNKDDEYEDYELKLSKDLLNSSQTWSEKEISTEEISFSYSTEPSSITKFTNILDSLTQYLNKHTTPAVSVIYKNSDDDIALEKKHDNGSKIFAPTESTMQSKFTDNFDLPIGPRNKDRINVPQSYTYNTIPHKNMTVRYNNTVIHHTTQDYVNDYNTPVVTETMYKQTLSGSQVSNHNPIPTKIINIDRTGPHFLYNSATVSQNNGGREHMLQHISHNEPILEIAHHRPILPQNIANNRETLRNVEDIPLNIRNYGTLHGNIAAREHLAETLVQHVPENNIPPVQISLSNTPHQAHGMRNFGHGSGIESPVDNDSLHQSIASQGQILDDGINNQAPMLANIQNQIQNIVSHHVNENYNPVPNAADLQIPILYNNTVLHSSVSQHNTAFSNSYGKGVYEELIPDDGMATTEPAPQLAPNYHLQYILHARP